MDLQKPSLCFLAPSDLVDIRQVEGLLVFVQVYEMRHVKEAQVVHDLPRIVLGHLYLEQVHVFRSIYIG